MVKTSTFMSEWFQDNLPKFAFDLGLSALPRCPEEQEKFYQRFIGRSKACELMGPEVSANRWFSIVKGIEFHDAEWTLERLSVKRFVEKRLRRPLREDETHLIWPTADPKKNAAAQIKQLRDQSGNKDSLGRGPPLFRPCLANQGPRYLLRGLARAPPNRAYPSPPGPRPAKPRRALPSLASGARWGTARRGRARRGMPGLAQPSLVKPRQALPPGHGGARRGMDMARGLRRGRAGHRDMVGRPRPIAKHP